MTQPTRLLRFKDVQEKTKLTKSWLREQIAAGNFPGPIKCGKRVAAFPEHEIDAWIAERIAERDARAA